jgi:hypothetical protein
MKRNRLFSRASTLMIAAVVLLFAVLGCGLLPTSGGEPEIEFQAREDQVEPGECTVLERDVQGAEGYLVFLDGEEVHASGREEVCPEEPTAYKLVVGGPGGPLRGEGDHSRAWPGADTDPDACAPNRCADH